MVRHVSKTMSGRAKTLELRTDLAGRPRYYLAGRPVPGGSVVQLCFSGGWVTGRFDWSGELGARHRFYCSIELDGGGVEEHVVEMPERALLRWPEA
jgi:hypothetical protein